MSPLLGSPLVIAPIFPAAFSNARKSTGYALLRQQVSFIIVIMQMWALILKLCNNTLIHDRRHIKAYSFSKNFNNTIHTCNVFFNVFVYDYILYIYTIYTLCIHYTLNTLYIQHINPIIKILLKNYRPLWREYALICLL
jgi:hypothetical protein